MNIEQLKLQVQAQQRELDATGKLISELTYRVAEEREYTHSLIQKAQKPEQVIPPSSEPTPSKAEKIAAMTDDQLLMAMSNPKKMEELFKGL